MKVIDPFLIHIVDAVDEINQMLKGYNFKKFTNDRKTELAVYKLLENIGEACNRIESDFQEQNPEIPWAKIIAMRNKLVHEYWDIDPKAVWKAATIYAPELKTALEPFVSRIDRSIFEQDWD